MRLLWQTLILVKSTKVIPEHLPKQTVLIKNIIGTKTRCSTSIKLLYDNCLGNSLFVNPDEMKVIFFEILNYYEVQHQQNSHNFTVGHLEGAIKMLYIVTL